jgi:hypothetical protein
MKTRALFVLTAIAALAISCASTGDDGFLVKNLDDANKSIALTNQGIAAYNSYLVEQGAYDKAQTVREYFVVALRYDSTNPRAQQYLNKVEDFKNTLLRDKLKVANKLLAKKNAQG